MPSIVPPIHHPYHRIQTLDPANQAAVCTIRLWAVNYDDKIRRKDIILSLHGVMDEECTTRLEHPISFGGHRGGGVGGATRGATPPSVANLPCHATTSMIGFWLIDLMA